MIGRASALASGVFDTIKRQGLSWSVTKIGARCGLLFAPAPPRNGADCAAARQEALETWLDLFCLNEGLLASSSPPTWLTCPATSEGDVARHTELFARFVETAITEGAIAP
jgi:glutamate-1-semialdehyde 2,1-aminomutase